MKRDVASLVVGLVCMAVATIVLLTELGGLTTSRLGVVAPVILISIGVVGLLASRRNHNP